MTLILLLLLGYGSVHCQQVKSNTVKFHMNNLPVEEPTVLPDTRPPEINILTPDISEGANYQTEAEEIDLIGEVTDQSRIRFISINAEVRTVNETGIFSTRLKLSPGENRIRLVAMDENRNMQEQYITIEYTPPVVTLADRIAEESTYYGLIIGIGRYNDPNLPDLENPVKDAEKLYNTLIKSYSFQSNNVTFLRNPGRNKLIFALDNLAGKVTPNDNVLIFYAGHGTWDEKANIGYWLPSDADLTTTANWFRNSTLVDYLKAIDSKHTLLITDACFAGSIFKSRSVFPNHNKAYEILYGLQSRKAMTSGTLTEVPDRSSFIRYLIERLDENEETYLSSEQLFSSFRIAVINNSDAIPQYGEIQNVGDEGGDFIFLKKR